MHDETSASSALLGWTQLTAVVTLTFIVASPSRLVVVGYCFHVVVNGDMPITEKFACSTVWIVTRAGSAAPVTSISHATSIAVPSLAKGSARPHARIMSDPGAGGPARN